MFYGCILQSYYVKGFVYKMIVIEGFGRTLVTEIFTQIWEHPIDIYSLQHPIVQPFYNKGMTQTVRCWLLINPG